MLLEGEPIRTFIWRMPLKKVPPSGKYRRGIEGNKAKSVYGG
jgi:hypothetical protein